MRRPRTLQAFTPDQRNAAHAFLAARVASMMGRKWEEGDWASVYCRAKGIPERGWSNLGIDLVHEGLGIEHKMMRPGERRVVDVFGTRLMHPSATRSVRIVDTDDPDVAMQSVLTQYRDLLRRHKETVRQQFPGTEPDMRTGWLLWQSNMRQFLYFEEETVEPNLDDYTAEWHESQERGARKAARSLWIYERASREKAFSVTTTAGAKIQPYFVVPPRSDPNVYLFCVQGEVQPDGMVKVWIPVGTAHLLSMILGGELTPQRLTDAITQASQQQHQATETEVRAAPDAAQMLLLPVGAYEMLNQMFPEPLSDAHLIQQLVEVLINTGTTAR